MDAILVPREQLIVETINENMGKTKLLDEWQMLINENFPNLMRMRKRTITHLIGFLGRKGHFIITKEKKCNSLFYTFESE